MSQCKTCKNTAFIRINLLDYCKECYLCNFYKKTIGNLKKLNQNKNILLYFSSYPEALIILDLLNVFFSKEKIKCLVHISSKNRNILDLVKEYKNISTSAVLCDIGENLYKEKKSLNPVFEKYIQESNIGIVIYGTIIEEIVLDCLLDVIHGNGKKASENVHRVKSTFGKVLRILNILETVREKELMYYFYLNNIKRTAQIRTDNFKEENIKKSLKQFLQDASRKNGLVHYNILNTFRRL